MPSGTHLTAGYGCFSSDDCRLDITVYALTEDMERSEGLCGNYNGQENDDLMVRGGTTVDSGSEPIAFTTSYVWANIAVLVCRHCR